MQNSTSRKANEQDKSHRLLRTQSDIRILTITVNKSWKPATIHYMQSSFFTQFQFFYCCFGLDSCKKSKKLVKELYVNVFHFIISLKKSAAFQNFFLNISNLPASKNTHLVKTKDLKIFITSHTKIKSLKRVPQFMNS